MTALILVPVIPRLLEDSRKQMESWGSAGTFDPFDKVYEVGEMLHFIALINGDFWLSKTACVSAYHAQPIFYGNFR